MRGHLKQGFGQIVQQNVITGPKLIEAEETDTGCPQLDVYTSWQIIRADLMRPTP